MLTRTPDEARFAVSPTGECSLHSAAPVEVGESGPCAEPITSEKMRIAIAENLPQKKIPCAWTPLREKSNANRERREDRASERGGARATGEKSARVVLGVAVSKRHHEIFARRSNGSTSTRQAERLQPRARVVSVKLLIIEKGNGRRRFAPALV